MRKGVAACDRHAVVATCKTCKLIARALPPLQVQAQQSWAERAHHQAAGQRRAPHDQAARVHPPRPVSHRSRLVVALPLLASRQPWPAEWLLRTAPNATPVVIAALRTASRLSGNFFEVQPFRSSLRRCTCWPSRWGGCGCPGCGVAAASVAGEATTGCARRVSRPPLRPFATARECYCILGQDKITIFQFASDRL